MHEGSPELEGLIPLGGRSVWEPVHVLGWNPGHELEECEYEVTEGSTACSRTATPEPRSSGDSKNHFLINRFKREAGYPQHGRQSALRFPPIGLAVMAGTSRFRQCV